MAEKIQLVIEVDDKGSLKVREFTREVDKDTKQMTQGNENLSASWASLTAKVAAAAAIFYGVARAVSSFVNEAAEAEQIENRLRFALETAGYSWNAAKSAVDEFAQSIQETTRFSEEKARQALTDMMMYTNDFAKAQMGARLAMDMSIRTGQDLGSTSRLIGMAMSGNVEMLGKYIFELRDLDARLGSNATNAEKASYAMKVLQEKFGGTPQADITTYTGKLDQFKNAWSDFKKMIGNELLPVLKDVLDYLTKITKEMTKEVPYKETSLFKILGIEVTRRIPLKGEDLEEVLRQRQRIAQFQAQKIKEETKADILPEKQIDIVKEVQAAIEGATYAEEQRGIVALAQHELAESGWTKEKDIVEQVREEIARLERETNEWGEITVGRQELVEAGWAAQAKKTDDLTKTWDSLALNISNAWATNMTNIVRGTGDASEKIKNFFQSIADVFLSAVSKMITNWLLLGNVMGEKKPISEGGGWGGILGWIGSLFKEGGVVAGFKPIASIPRFQHGAVVDRPTLAMVGEGGEKEWIIPDSKIGKGSSQGTIVNHFHINAVDVESFINLCKRNPGGILSAVANDIKIRGNTKSIIDRYSR